MRSGLHAGQERPERESGGDSDALDGDDDERHNQKDGELEE